MFLMFCICNVIPLVVIVENLENDKGLIAMDFNINKLLFYVWQNLNCELICVKN
jgi:hypothetical protein